MDKTLIKQTLLEEIQKTEKSVEEYRELTQAIAPDDAIGRVSRMDAINNKSINEASLRQAQQKLSGLKRALNQLDDKDFGICRKCNNPIPVGRLMIRPESVFCVRCAS